MSTKLQPARGTKDILMDEYPLHRFVTETARKTAELYGFKEMATPIFEFTDVFKRTLGDTSDVVTKEMYTFESKGGDMLTLRPEFTAGIVRAVISNGLTQSLPLKLFSTGPIFRYERPEKGRYRQFHQVNMEFLGAAEPQADVEVISLAAHILKALGADTGARLELNSLGDTASRESYRSALVEYLQDFRTQLSEESKIRLEKNPMRILDSKDEGDQAIVRNAPLLKDYYSAEAQDFFNHVKEGLDAIGLAYHVNEKLVRGLDYYCHTAFEFTTDFFGTSKAVLAGGRYDGLVELMGGPSTPAIGFAGGVERLAALATAYHTKPAQLIALIPIGEVAEKQALALAAQLRQEGYAVDMAFSGNVGKRFKKADKAGANTALVFGDDELSQGIVKQRDLATGEERNVRLEEIVDMLAA